MVVKKRIRSKVKQTKVKRSKIKRTMKRSLKRRSFKKTKRTKRIKRKKRTKRMKRMKGGEDPEREAPMGYCWKEKPTFKGALVPSFVDWPKRYIKIEGNSLNVYDNHEGAQRRQTPRGSSIEDLTGATIVESTETFMSRKGKKAFPLLTITKGTEVVKLLFSRQWQTPATNDSPQSVNPEVQGLQKLRQFKAGLENISEGRQWNVSAEEEAAAARRIQAIQRGKMVKKEVATKKAAAIEIQSAFRGKQGRREGLEKRQERLEETGKMMRGNRRSYLKSGIGFARVGLRGFVSPEGDYHKSLSPCSFDYSVQQCGPTCWFTSITTFIVKNKNIRLLLMAARFKRGSNSELSQWLSKLHGEQIESILTLGDAAKCSLYSQNMCLGLPDSLKVLINLYSIMNVRTNKTYDHLCEIKTIKNVLMGHYKHEVDQEYFFSDAPLNPYNPEVTLATILSGLLFHKYEDTYCVNIDLLSLSTNNYGIPLAEKIKESMVDRPIGMLILANITENNCPITLFGYLEKIYETLEILDGDITVVGGTLSVISLQDTPSDETSFKPIGGKVPIGGSDHAIIFKVCFGEGGRIRIHISDTGVGIDYLIWWEDGVRQTQGIDERSLNLHGNFYMSLNETCREKFLREDVHRRNKLEELYTDTEGDLKWLPLSLSSETLETGEVTIEDKMSEIIRTHCLCVRGIQTLILMNYSKLETHSVFPDKELPCSIQPFLHSYMDLKTKNEEEREKIRSDINFIKEVIVTEESRGQRLPLARVSDTEEVSKKSERDMESWKILRTQPWKYGDTDTGLSVIESVTGL